MTTAIYYTQEPSPLGPLTLIADNEGLRGVYFQEHKHRPAQSKNWHHDDSTRFDAARRALSAYFSGKQSIPHLRLSPIPGSEFQRKVWEALREIPFGEKVTYGELAFRLGSPKAVRAVGAAVGRNPWSILTPCHRVVGANGSLTGFAGGLARKRWLLDYESCNLLKLVAS